MIELLCIQRNFNVELSLFEPVITRPTVVKLLHVGCIDSREPQNMFISELISSCNSYPTPYLHLATSEM